MSEQEKQELLNKYRKLSEDEDRILERMKEVHTKTPYTVPNVVNKNSQICFVFSCPGREELIKNAPCQGVTGDNLGALLKILNKKKKNLFESSDKTNYDILNATTTVHFKRLDDKTEGTKQEISEGRREIEKYVAENKNLKYAILFGCKAESLTDVFGEKAIVSRHLGYQSINQIDRDENGEVISSDTIADPKDRTTKRLNIVAAEILKKIEEREKNKTQ